LAPPKIELAESSSTSYEKEKKTSEKELKRKTF